MVAVSFMAPPVMIPSLFFITIISYCPKSAIICYIVESHCITFFDKYKTQLIIVQIKVVESDYRYDEKARRGRKKRTGVGMTSVRFFSVP